jgi:pimeloyl-ACP methyl ester carboxylesterase
MKRTTLDDQTGRTEYVDVAGGRIAYEWSGMGRWWCCPPGMADTRSTYRFLAPLIANAGYRVASIDLRGHGESSADWGSYSHADTAGDLIEVIRKLGGR